MAKLGIHRDFLQDLVRLERPIQQKVVETILKFEQTSHAGAHLEKLSNVRDDRLKSIRIDLKYRGIVLAPETGDRYTLLRVDNHDDAYAWARNRRISVNAATGHMEIRDTETIDATIQRLTRDTGSAVRPVFAHVSDADLTRLGVDAQVRKFARMLTDIGMLEALEGRLPQVQYDVLIGLASGMSPEEVWDDIVGSPKPEAYDPNDVDAAVRRMPDKVALVEGAEEIIELFDKPFARWRIYLHPTQRETAYRTYSGSAQVLGGPGTGKTVVALHRARHLAAQGGRVLLTTFTTTLTRSLTDSLRLLESDDEVLSRIDVLTVDQVARRAVERRLGRFTLVQSDEERAMWRRIIRRRELEYSETFLMEEWRQVVLAQDAMDLDGYLAARRTGRGKRLGPLQRAQIWRAITEFEQELNKSNARTYETVCATAARLLAEEDDKPYDHVVVDEAQDLHPVRWRVLRSAVSTGQDDIFLAGDAHQRIYDNRVSLGSVGIHVAGRSTRLTINYRTTAEILSWSLAMLAGEKVLGLEDEPITLAGYRSEIHGERPRLFGATTKNAELAYVATVVRGWIDAGVSADEIGIAARSGPHAQDAVAALTRAGIPASHLTRDKDAVEGHVQVMTMHRMKGLEFRCVAVIGVGAGQIPSAGAVRPLEEDATTHWNDLQRERCLLFVACTRARERLAVSWHGEPSPFLN
ncbi:UvrD-helicase domain-containing protein [Streptosporangium pseudovulgare]|uniref:DNA 3'-5' helicase n=1 Tax=Streptosporangium pseudovulgare TaxID=35765 RepID=A0ABQ2QQE8_9ACTN|nr:UvrD-helicase domain-containing protein [Streptosporangium pseudovulgare]GGP91154.1 DNA helicase [Streptosporangium pseudovulgare]